ncbi:MAG TPA: hypothetical protein PKE03_12770, partial [Bacteroidales bacterium]|nr:hypothetical protein [Bacteroidales bacterium]
MSEACEIHRHHRSGHTNCRKGITGLMLSDDNALQEHEIRDRLSADYDRTTFCRSFKNQGGIG